MMKRAGLMLLPLLAACSQEKGTDEEAIAAIAPQAILYPDISGNKLFGAGCAFVASGGGMGAVLMAFEDRAAIKLDGKIVMLASDAASAKLPDGAWTRYAGNEYGLTLKGTGPVQALGGVNKLPGKMVVTDSSGRPVYEASGDIQCRPQ